MGYMNEKCPGGDHPKDCPGDLCCQSCYDRIPARLPGHAKAWRRRRVAAGRMRFWSEIKMLNADLIAWLESHPQEGSDG